MKTCRRCDQPKPLDAFYRRRGSSDGFHSWCIACMADNDRARRGTPKDIERHRRYYERHGKRIVARQRFARYGISEQVFKNLRTAQKWRCAICDRKCLVFCIDHDHDTGAVRGLLCNPCNSGLGFLGDNLPSLMKAVAYLGG